MTKTISSPVERWPGEVILHDPLTLPMVAAWEEAVEDARPVRSLSGKHLAYLSGVLACVKEWHIGGGFPEFPTVDNFPTKPWQDRHDFMLWLIGEVSTLYVEATTIPNG